MSARVIPPAPGRVLIIGDGTLASATVQRLEAAGYQCARAATRHAMTEAAEALHPEAILLSSTRPEDALRWIHHVPALRDLPVIGDGRLPDLAQRSITVDDWVRTEADLPQRIESAVRARRLIERDDLARRRMEVLLEITQAATSSLELEQILRIAVERISQVVSNDRCSVVLIEGNGPRLARVVASREAPRMAALPVDIMKYPELRRALETKQAVYIEDASTDPLLDAVRDRISPHNVRSILVQPLVHQDDVVGALFLRLSRSGDGFGREEQELARAVAGALANSVRNARLHAALKKKRDDLESAYVDRYRELIEANRRLKELNRVKDELIAVVSHDLRAPLQVLLGHGRILLDSKLTDAEKLSADAIVRQGKKILGLVESLLERGKGEQARVSLEPALLDIAELCQEIAGDLTILASERKISVRAETPESLMVIGDEVKLREVLQNLMTNAIQHAARGVVVLSQRLKRPDGDAMRVVVRDDGPGIPKEQLHTVFDRYRHGPGGIGLGLAICKEFVELHGGEIWAENPPEGGCAFVFTLALAKEHRAAPAAPAPFDVAEQPRVLVVEDEPEIAAVLGEILRSRYRVELARDGAEGLAKARALHPDLIVMDVFLPKLDGLDAAVALKQAGDTADIPVILLSAHKGVAEKVRALNLGAVDYMHKPFQALELLSRTERAIKLRDAERELQRSLNLLRRTGADPETGFLDRAGLVSRLEQELSRACRYARPLCLGAVTPAAPIIQSVRSVASAIRGKLRTPDVVAHLGEGRFAILLPECPRPAAHQVMGRVVAELRTLAGCDFEVSIIDAVAAENTAEALVERLAPPSVP